MGAGVIAILVYVLSPLVTISVLRKLFNDASRLVWLVGLAAGPLLVALMQYGLFYILPGQMPWLYPLLISGVLLVLGIGCREWIGLKRLVWPRPTFNMYTLYVGVVVGVVLVLMVINPPMWGDVIEYIKQAYVYSQDRGLWRTDTGIPFTTESMRHVLNPAIRPGIPMLYSLFFLVAEPTPYVLTLTHLVYFYYLVVLLLTVGYGGQRLGLRGRAALLPAVITLACFYLVRFTILGAKEIILMTLTTLSLYSLDELGRHKIVVWKYLVLMGITMGLGTLLNFSGTIIALIMGLLLMLWVRYSIKLRLLLASVLLGLTLIFGGGELWNGLSNFVFSSAPLSQGTQVVDAAKVRQMELANYKLNEKDVLWRGKLQSWTQPQFFGLVYPIWLIILVLAWKTRQVMTDLEKLLLLYVGIYFLIIIDPLFLNPHPYAYVLSISPKYSLMLLPMVALSLAGRLVTVRYIQGKIPHNLVYASAVLILLLLPAVRNLLGEQGVNVIATWMPLSNTREYYRSLLNSLMISAGTTGLLVVVTAKYWQKHYGKLAVIGLLMFPSLVLIYSNFLR